MSIQFQLRRGTTSQINAITPAVGEILYDTSRHSIVVGDSVQAGGYPFPWLNSSGWVGIGASPTAPLTVASTYTDPATSQNHISISPVYVYTVNNSNQINGISLNFGNWTVPAGVTISSAYSSIRTDAFINNAGFAGTMSLQQGIWCRAGILLAASTAVITTAASVVAEIQNAIAGATIGTASAFRVNTGTIAGIITNFYGFYMPAMSVTGTLTNRYGVRIEDTVAVNYFAGQIQGSLGSVGAPGYSFINDTNTGMYALTADTLGLATAGVLALQIDPTQNVSIGGTASNIKLYVKQSGAGFTAARFDNVSNGQATMQVVNADTTGNNVFIGFYTEASPTVRGTISYNRGSAVVAYNTTSDKRLKNRASKQRPFRDIIDGIWVGDVEFKTNPGKSLLGIMAQDCYEIYPDAITKPDSEAGIWQADYGRFAPLALWGVQDLYREIGALRRELASLKGLH